MKSTLLDTSIIDAVFSVEPIAYELAALLKVKALHKGRGATRAEKAIRDELARSLFLANLDTIHADGFTFTIDPEPIAVVSLDGPGQPIEAEVLSRLQVHRAKVKPGLDGRRTLRTALENALSDGA